MAEIRAIIPAGTARALQIYHWRVLLAIALDRRQLGHASWIADQILREVGR